MLLWAKQRGYPHWPAKLLAVHGDTVTVRFFGQHGRAKILAMHCRLMSENSPNKSVKKQEQASFRTARNVNTLKIFVLINGVLVAFF